MEKDEIKARLNGMSLEELRENLMYYVMRMDDKEQNEFFGVSQ